MAKKKKTIEDICFSVPEAFSLTTKPLPTNDLNEIVKKSLIEQTIKIAYRLSIPYEFNNYSNPKKPYSIITEEQLETVAGLFQALQPKDAIEAALAQQFIIVHLQTIKSVSEGIGELGIKKLELTHAILEAFQKYRSKGAQLISVNYNHNQAQINNINVVKEESLQPTIEVKNEL
jgi:hypothetical protein